jgi:hypothetical protein
MLKQIYFYIYFVLNKSLKNDFPNKIDENDTFMQ